MDYSALEELFSRKNEEPVISKGAEKKKTTEAIIKFKSFSIFPTIVITRVMLLFGNRSLIQWLSCIQLLEYFLYSSSFGCDAVENVSYTSGHKPLIVNSLS